MTISSWGDITPFEIEDSLDMALPAYPELHFMNLKGVECDQFVANFDFTHLPALETISLVGCTSPTAFLRLLLPSQDRANNDHIWPLLQNIRLGCLDAVAVDYLCEVILYRCAIGKPIKSVKFGSHSFENSPEKVDWMKQRVKVQRVVCWSYRCPIQRS
jgi:hypothetical protein